MIPNSERKKILVVSDDSDMQAFLSNLLLAVNTQPFGAESRQAGLKRVKTRHPDLVILDVMMADRQGIKFYLDLKNDPLCRHIPVIMISTIDRETFFPCEKFFTGCNTPEPEGYLEKPPEAEDLLMLIHRLVKTGTVEPVYSEAQRRSYLPNERGKYRR